MGVRCRRTRGVGIGRDNYRAEKCFLSALLSLWFLDPDESSRAEPRTFLSEVEEVESNIMIEKGDLLGKEGRVKSRESDREASLSNRMER